MYTGDTNGDDGPCCEYSILASSKNTHLKAHTKSKKKKNSRNKQKKTKTKEKQASAIGTLQLLGFFQQGLKNLFYF